MFSQTNGAGFHIKLNLVDTTSNTIHGSFNLLCIFWGVGMSHISLLRSITLWSYRSRQYPWCQYRCLWGRPKYRYYWMSCNDVGANTFTNLSSLQMTLMNACIYIVSFHAENLFFLSFTNWSSAHSLRGSVSQSWSRNVNKIVKIPWIAILAIISDSLLSGFLFHKWKRFSSVSPSWEQIEELWAVCGLYGEDGATLLVVTWLVPWKIGDDNWMKNVS